MTGYATTSRRIAVLLLVGLSLVAAVAPAGVAAAGASSTDAALSTSTTTVQNDTEPRNDTEPQNVTTPQNSTAPQNGTPAQNGSSGEEDAEGSDGEDSFYGQGEDDGPTIASQARITPVQADEDWLETSVRSSDESYDTRGPFATFELSEPVDAVRIEQPNAEAKVVGGSVIRVEYAPEAGSEDQESLYQLELFFEDDSSKTVDLYASETDVSVEAAKYTEYSDLIDYLEGQAESEGYETTPDGLRSYVEDKEEVADILNTFLSGHAKEFFAILTAMLSNPFTWILGTGVIVGLLSFTLYRHGWMLKKLDRGKSEAELIREAIRLQHQNDKEAAASHDLGDVDEIGPNAVRYWNTIDVHTVGNMVQVVCNGVVDLDDEGRIVRDEDGNKRMVHNGIDDLLAVDPLTEEQLRSQTWLNPLLLTDRLSARTALSNIRAALLVAENEYGLGPEVREDRRRIEQLIDELQGKYDTPTPNNTPSSGTHAAAGGDD